MMQVDDLLKDPMLKLRLMTPSSAQRLRRTVRWCAPTELMDPAGFLSDDCLMLTSGIGLAFSDPRTWDAYVERLTAVPIAALAFSIGLAHDTMPDGLVRACTERDLPLLEVPSLVPPLQVGRHVESWIRRERLHAQQRSWSLADECARLANDGADLATILAAVHAEVRAPLAIYDAYGSVVAQCPTSLRWPPLDDRDATTDLIALPMGLERPCHLAVRAGAGTARRELLAPTASILALQLKRALAADVERHRALVALLSRCDDWESGNRLDIHRLLATLGIDRDLDTSIVLADLTGERQALSWQVRLALQESFEVVIATEHEGRLVALCQRMRLPAEHMRDRILSLDRTQPLVLRETIGDYDAIRLGMTHALDVLRRAQGPVHAPELGLTAIVAATAGRGARLEAQRFLDPILDPSTGRTGEQMVATLRAFVRNDAQSGPTAESLFIHRNTLGYRLRKIEQLLRVDLSTIEAQATCLVALRLVGLED